MKNDEKRWKTGNLRSFFPWHGHKAASFCRHCKNMDWRITGCGKDCSHEKSVLFFLLAHFVAWHQCGKLSRVHIALEWQETIQVICIHNSVSIIFAPWNNDVQDFRSASKLPNVSVATCFAMHKEWNLKITDQKWRKSVQVLIFWWRLLVALPIFPQLQATYTPHPD